MTATTDHVPSVAEFDFDPFSHEFLSDPYPFHEQIREGGPVVRLRHYDIWATARHEQVFAALTDPETYCSGAGVGLTDFRKEKPWRPPSLLLEADPPNHTQVRDVMSTVLSSRAIRPCGRRSRRRPTSSSTSSWHGVGSTPYAISPTSFLSGSSPTRSAFRRRAGRT